MWIGVEPTNDGFADQSLTAWVPHQNVIIIYQILDFMSIVIHIKKFYNFLGFDNKTEKFFICLIFIPLPFRRSKAPGCFYILGLVFANPFFYSSLIL